VTTARRRLTTPEPVKRLIEPVEHLLATESASGVILITTAVIAFAWANSPWEPVYEALRMLPAGIALGPFELRLPLEYWVNDLLMAFFFFLVGLEIKREVLVGELAGLQKAALPVAGALGGMVVPALIYVAFNHGTPYAAGWGVPMATDIAFAVGVLALLGSRVPLGAKVFLLALAIVDDLGAVLVIALFYTADLQIGALVGSVVVWLVAVGYGLIGGRRPLVYLLLGLVVWDLMFLSGVHPTIAGVLMAISVPLVQPMSSEELKKELAAEVGPDPLERSQVEIGHLEGVLSRAHSPLHRFEHVLAPYVAFFIMPVFALFNAGVPVLHSSEAQLVSTATLGAFFGLLIGKPVGILGFVALACMLRLTRLPSDSSWSTIVGVGCVAGIGFTMALFIANLAFADVVALDQAKIGVLAASVVAAILGLVVLNRVLPRRGTSDG
jgi:NhaA family Na+:H+ antiporter